MCRIVNETKIRNRTGTPREAAGSQEASYEDGTGDVEIEATVILQGDRKTDIKIIKNKYNEY